MVLELLKPLLEGASGWLDIIVVVAIAYFGIKYYLASSGATADDRPLLHKIIGLGTSLYKRSSTGDAATAIKHMNAITELATRYGANDVAEKVTELQAPLFLAIHNLKGKKNEQ